jgi:hypothetical protein
VECALDELILLPRFATRETDWFRCVEVEVIVINGVLEMRK